MPDRALSTHLTRNAAAERDRLATAVKAVLGTLNYYIGPAARTAVSHETEAEYWRLLLAYKRAVGEPCPRCADTGIDKHYVGEHPCSLAAVEGH